MYGFNLILVSFPSIIKIRKNNAIIENKNNAGQRNNINIQQRYATCINQLHLRIDQCLLLPPPPSTLGIVWPLRPGESVCVCVGGGGGREGGEYFAK